MKMKQKKPFIFAALLIFFSSCTEQEQQQQVLIDFSPVYGNYTTICHRTLLIGNPEHWIDTIYTQPLNVQMFNATEGSIVITSTDTNTIYPSAIAYTDGILVGSTFYFGAYVYHTRVATVAFRNDSIFASWEHLNDLSQTASWVGVKD
jgi:hypothetical protein